jgi:uncharacterized RDD family membrane protein YckC
MNYYVAKNGVQLGQLPEEEIIRRTQSGELSPTDLFWTEGMKDWLPLGSNFQRPLAAPTPLAAPNPYAPPSSEGLKTPAEVDHLELADRGTRLGAALIEGLIFTIAASPLILAIAMSDQNLKAGGSAEMRNIALMSLGALLVLAVGIYQLVILSTRGQSIGKRILGIRIVSCEDGRNPGGVKTILLRGFLPGLITNIPLIGFIFSLADTCFIFREDRRCIHDHMAGTQVVNGHPPR